MFRLLTPLLIALGFITAASAQAGPRRAPRARAAQFTGASSGCVSNPPAQATLRAHTIPKGGVDIHVVQSLVDDAERTAESPSTRQFNGGTVVITDGFRGCRRNANTRGSAKNSAHLRGHAIDIRSNMGNPYSYAMAIQAAGLHRGGGFYNSCVAHVHLDTEHPTFLNECGGKGGFGRSHGSRRARKARAR
jgi:hypothetical protein